MGQSRNNKTMYVGIKDVDTMTKEIQEEQRNGTKEALAKYKNSKGEIITEDKVSAEIAIGRQALIEARLRGRVDFYHTDEVIVRTEQYFEACEKSGTFPSMMGLASRGFGVYRQLVQDFMNKHPEHPTSIYLMMVKENMADILTNASLHNHANVAQTIFQLKNHFEHADEVKITKSNNEDPLLMGAVSEEEIKKRYKQSVVYDD